MVRSGTRGILKFELHVYDKRETLSLRSRYKKELCRHGPPHRRNSRSARNKEREPTTSRDPSGKNTITMRCVLIAHGGACQRCPKISSSHGPRASVGGAADTRDATHSGTPHPVELTSVRDATPRSVSLYQYCFWISSSAHARVPWARRPARGGSGSEGETYTALGRLLSPHAPSRQGMAARAVVSST